MPVLALSPVPGDVDIVIASELMEAGRALQRGLVTADRTTFVASTHRVYSMTERTAMGDGRVDADKLLAGGQGRPNNSSRRLRASCRGVRQPDQPRAVRRAGRHRPPALQPRAVRSTISRGGVGVKPSLKAFAAGFTRAQGGDDGETVEAEPLATPTPQPRHPAVRALVERAQRDFPVAVQDFLLEGVRRLIDYQDTAYAGLYLDRMAAIAALPNDDGHRLLRETARHLALWMSYEDTARVAALKTRATRFERVRGEARVQPGQVLAINEYMHPRLQEICETLPGGIGRWLMGSTLPKKIVERFTQHGRVIQTSSLRGYLMLRTVAAMKRWRRSTMRYAEENRRIEEWLQRIAATAQRNPELAVELAQCQRLVKGYSDTHERGIRNYDTVMRAVERAGAALAPATLRELRDAALADEHGHKLQAALAQHALA
jgi:indolepyruvate ferredoxin oxidoreductase beta subunit